VLAPVHQVEARQGHVENQASPRSPAIFGVKLPSQLYLAALRSVARACHSSGCFKVGGASQVGSGWCVYGESLGVSKPEVVGMV